MWILLFIQFLRLRSALVDVICLDLCCSHHYLLFEISCYVVRARPQTSLARKGRWSQRYTAKRRITKIGAPRVIGSVRMKKKKKIALCILSSWSIENIIIGSISLNIVCLRLDYLQWMIQCCSLSYSSVNCSWFLNQVPLD